ncbi:MAG: hypothetical protein KME29_35610 [Calothrix sp. FI2-JRJ7]|nr:hypothetical protein [Calothrix sp. FI2-JRJ7]
MTTAPVNSSQADMAKQSVRAARTGGITEHKLLGMYGSIFLANSSCRTR